MRKRPRVSTAARAAVPRARSSVDALMLSLPGAQTWVETGFITTVSKVIGEKQAVRGRSPGQYFSHQLPCPSPPHSLSCAPHPAPTLHLRVVQRWSNNFYGRVFQRSHV